MPNSIDLCGTFEANIYLSPKDYVFPITKPHVEKVNDFGGLTIKVVKAASMRSSAVECELGWNLNLNEADTKFYKKFLELERNDRYTLEEAVKAVNWMKSKRGEIRLLTITYHAALDKGGKVVQHVYMGYDNDRLELRFPKGQQPVDLRLRVAEMKQITAVFEFKDVFSK